ncbi:uncharacterized protein GVI51_J09713 [Nakaseomyces glabratus]|uniref:Transcription factor tau 95 kDa subunit n=2 Tax=Candida glabrata TaxID=5478 RepID=Q6FNQ5_CANGA|nr:uncharacterized protein CAGL0J09878g [Nakaseomyces glabratus]KAH7583745.1 RNA polymerase III transcription factor (TF)IIIC subunit HTH domain [Nakaseomyces glabratus]KAH7585478.1 RNA polymerase III transcription factor (TF)IIIC subunit HTH domain [Nakaseomyces glabratus]KAH7598557.1 RNA polymerase III transcription factor (TF)IIIC subunit HTH domain [Nakaseomyces glabratus]KAH7604846.1 RNA polymerase III transcription factor (TF)IIIC subunit HTH domain [Nakaseomyces glabratus]KAI8385486.1 R|eukprot:XP_448139.1 uncharacterized protein CAGL0J09878g [[Candida] glabrata]
MESNDTPAMEDVSQAVSSKYARYHTLDLPRISSVEFPLAISTKKHSIVRAIEMCGGIEDVKQALDNSTEPSVTDKGLELFLNNGLSPVDPWDDATSSARKPFFNEHPIIGKRVPFRDDSIVLKITMPEGTLEKNGNDVAKALRSLDSKDVCATPVAVVNNTIKFREMSDFQVILDNVPAAREFQKSFGSLDWQNIKKFIDSVPDNDSRPQDNINNIILDRSVKSPNCDFQLPPPPRFSMVGYPLQYKYKGNPFAVKKENGDHEVKGSYLKNYQLFVHDMSPELKVPVEPQDKLLEIYNQAKQSGVYPGTKKESKFFEALEECLAILRSLFEKRPIWVKRHLDGLIPKNVYHTLKIALALLSYRFTMGPWRNTYIKFGVDPRSSSEYAKYQTEYFKIERKLLESATVRKNIPKPPPLVFESDTKDGIDSRFRFDGTRIPWYLMLQIDLLLDEPNIAEVYEKVEYLDKPNEVTGWFTALDLAKIRRIVKYELGCMVQGRYEFNKYKLKYFKSMLFFKESMMNNNGENTDVDGDTNMDRDKNPDDITQDDDEENNGVEAGEDEETLQEKEDAESDNMKVSVMKDISDDEQDEPEDDFDVNNATFQDIIGKIRRLDPELADKYSRDLSGLVNIAKLYD